MRAKNNYERLASLFQGHFNQKYTRVALRASSELRWALAVVVLILTVEALLHTLLFQSLGYRATGDTHELVKQLEHTLFRFVIAYLLYCLMFAWGGGKEIYKIDPQHNNRRRAGLIALHLALMLLIGAISFALHSVRHTAEYVELSFVWLALGVAAVAALLLSMAKSSDWIGGARLHRLALFVAIFPAALTVFAIDLSQKLWGSAARLTFLLVQNELSIFVANQYSDAPSKTLGTNRFLVIVTDQCSGMEGISLMLIFCAAFLWFYRRECRFPQVLVVMPFAAAAMFIFNSFRITALVLIGDAGYPAIASVGFHSQAGWIIFNLIAFSVALILRSSSAFRLDPQKRQRKEAIRNPVAPFLVPMLVVLSVGMFDRALSAGFEFLYPLRLIGAGAAVVFFRKQILDLEWRCSWRGVVVGAIVFCTWTFIDHIFYAPRGMPNELRAAPTVLRYGWTACRVLGATVTVPVVEELAFRGYLMRRFSSREFESVAFRNVGLAALFASSVVFGLIHGGMSVAGTVAGLAYGSLLILTGNFGEAVLAHATTNALIVLSVLVLGQWQLW